MLTKEEKYVALALSLFLLIGSFLLCGRSRGPGSGITVTRGAIREEMTLEDIGRMIKEDRKVNINTASREELISIPGIGGVTAEKIIAHRESRGRFYSEDGLLEVAGIGPKKLEKIREYVKTDQAER